MIAAAAFRMTSRKLRVPCAESASHPGLPAVASGVVRGAFDAVLQDENMVASSLSTAVRTMGTSLLQRVTESDSNIEVFRE